MLVVDDEATILFAMDQFFSILGYKVDCASDTDAASRHLAKTVYDVVVMDLRLSPAEEYQGLDLARSIRDRGLATKIILLTAYGSSTARARAEDLGIDCFIDKPRRLGEIAALIDAMFEPSSDRDNALASNQQTSGGDDGDTSQTRAPGPGR